MRFAVLSAVFLLTAVEASQSASEGDFQLQTAGELANLCASTTDAAAIHMCQGYLVGVHHMHQAVSEAADRRVYCVPEDGSVTRDSAASAYVGWVGANPAMASMSAREGLLEFARQTYPCQ